MDRRQVLQSLLGAALGGTTGNQAAAKAIEDGRGQLVCLVLTLPADMADPTTEEVERIRARFTESFGGQQPAPLFILPAGADLKPIYDRPGVEVAEERV